MNNISVIRCIYHDYTTIYYDMTVYDKYFCLVTINTFHYYAYLLRDYDYLLQIFIANIYYHYLLWYYTYSGIIYLLGYENAFIYNEIMIIYYDITIFITIFTTHTSDNRFRKNFYYVKEKFFISLLLQLHILISWNQQKC